MTYSNERDRWARWMQEQFALDIYADYWGIDKESDIEPVDQYRHQSGGMGEFSSRLDYSGIDKIIHQPHGTIQLGQRIRTAAKKEKYTTDFTLRTSTSNDDPPEFTKLKEAYEDPEMNMPKMYALGVAKEKEIVTGEGGGGYLSAGFKKFYLIYTERFISAFFAGDIERVPWGGRNRDGSTFDPFSIPDLHSVSAVAKEYVESELDELTNRAPRLGGRRTPTAKPNPDQSDLGDFGGGGE